MASHVFQNGTGGSVAQDYKKEPLRATDFLRYPHYYQALQQKVASTGAAPYLEMDGGVIPVAIYQAPNLSANDEAVNLAERKIRGAYGATDEGDYGSEVIQRPTCSEPTGRGQRTERHQLAEGGRRAATHFYNPCDNPPIELLRR